MGTKSVSGHIVGEVVGMKQALATGGRDLRPMNLYNKSSWYANHTARKIKNMTFDLINLRRFRTFVVVS